MDTRANEYHFHLPPELIAQDPAERRGDSRLLVVDPQLGPVSETVFRELPTLLRSGDLLVVNQSRVLPARLSTRRSDTGGKVEILLVSPVDKDVWLALARPARRLRPGLQLEVLPGAGSPAAGGEAAAASLTITACLEDGQVLVRGRPGPATIAARWGTMPLPPYIRRQSDSRADELRARRDRQRYQTVYAEAVDSAAGSVAAPTAGLHFSDHTLDGLRNAGINLARVTLHVGPGTFRPPDAAQIEALRLHEEWFELPAATCALLAETRAAGGRVIAVGTTALRVLETVSRLGLEARSESDFEAGPTPTDPVPVFEGRGVREDGHWSISGRTRLFIRPPDKVAAVDGLLTNFHLPGSSLLMLIAALLEGEVWREVYTQAVDRSMRFYSYGDCMLILPPGKG